jgi:hypothetical protein
MPQFDDNRPLRRRAAPIAGGRNSIRPPRANGHLAPLFLTNCHFVFFEAEAGTSNVTPSRPRDSRPTAPFPPNHVIPTQTRYSREGGKGVSAHHAPPLLESR